VDPTARSRRHIPSSLLVLAVAGAIGLLPSCGRHQTASGQAAPASTTGPGTTPPVASTTSTVGSPTTRATALTTSSTGGARRILAPATVAPTTDECNLTVTAQADGNVVPLLCPTGGVNVVAWDHYAKGAVGGGPLTASKTMAIGRAATAAQVGDAMCFDYRAVYGTKPLTMSAERLAAAYYGWAFTTDDPAKTFAQTECGPG
jgi:hypothetical protein